MFFQRRIDWRRGRKASDARDQEMRKRLGEADGDSTVQRRNTATPLCLAVRHSNGAPPPRRTSVD
jgi:hypothetical protein